MALCIDYMTVLASGLLYALTCFFRSSVAPLTDVLESEFNSTSSEVGLMASLFWLSYCIMQTPVGLLQTKVKEEKILICSSFVFSFTCFAFGIVQSESIILPAFFMLVSGICAAPMGLCFLSVVSKRFSNDHLASFGGIMFGSNAAVIVGGNMLQAWLYQNFSIWRPVYWVIACGTFAICILLIALKLTETCQSNDGPEYSKCNSVVNREQIITIDDTIDKASTPSTEIDIDTENLKDYHTGEVDEIPDDKEGIKTGKNAEESTSTLQKFKFVVCNPLNWVLAMHLFALNGIQYAFNGLWLINYMRLKYGISRQTSTLISGTYWIAYAVALISLGFVSRKYKKRKVIYCSTMFLLFVPPSIVVYGDENMSLIVIYLCNIISGCGMGVIAVIFVVVREYNDLMGSSDIATGFVNSVGISSGFIMQYLIGLLMDYHWEQRGGDFADDGGRIYDVSDYNCGFIVMPIVGALGIIASILVKETNGRPIEWRKK